MLADMLYNAGYWLGIASVMGILVCAIVIAAMSQDGGQ